jgi:hypothetical protein
MNSGNWTEYFDDLAVSKGEEHQKAVWGTPESIYSKFHVALRAIKLSGKQDLRRMLEAVGVREVGIAAVSSDKLGGTILPLHQWHTFSVHGIEVRNE